MPSDALETAEEEERSDASSSARPPKRRKFAKPSRVNLACSACRRLKRRCSGTTPCDQCIRAGRTAEQCNYEAVEHRKKEPVIEAASLASSTPSPPVAALNITTDRTQMSLATSLAGDATNIGAAQERGKRVANAITFLDFVQAAVLGESAYNYASPVDPPHVPKTLEISDDQLFKMPHRILANLFIARFFNVVAEVFPILHQPTFMAQYEAMWLDVPLGVQPKPLFLALVWSLMATGAAWLEDPTLEDDIEEYHARSKALTAWHMSQSGSVSLEFVYVMLMRYVHILAVAACISLRLHEKPQPGQFDPVTAELRKRAWRACFNLGSHLSLIVGSTPLALTSIEMTVDMPEKWPDGSAASGTSWMQVWSSLSVCTAGIVTALHIACQSKTTDGLEIILEMEAKLEAWKEGLSENWRIDLPTWQLASRHQILRLRYCYARLMIMRPALVRLLVPSVPSKAGGLRDLAWQGAFRLCLEAAHELIATAAHARQNVFFRNGKPYRCDYIFVALAVMLAARHKGYNEQFEEYWTEALIGIREALPGVAVRLECLKSHLDSRANADADDFLRDLLANIGD